MARTGGVRIGIGGALALAVAALVAIGGGLRARAEEGAREVRVAVAAEDEAGAAALGLMAFLAPRFWLKTQISVIVAPASEAEAPDLVVAPLAEAARLAEEQGAAAPAPVFGRGETVFAAVGLFEPGDKPAERFSDWLRGDVAKRAVEGYAPPDGVAFSPDVEIEEQDAEPEIAAATSEQLAEGEIISYRQCGRCHVIGERNRYGGIGSTPSFRALRGKPDWRERFELFWDERPHRAFSQVEGMTEPFDPRFPPPVMPIEMTLDEIDAMVAYVATLKPKDLGAPLKID